MDVKNYIGEVKCVAGYFMIEVYFYFFCCLGQNFFVVGIVKVVCQGDIVVGNKDVVVQFLKCRLWYFNNIFFFYWAVGFFWSECEFEVFIFFKFFELFFKGRK